MTKCYLDAKTGRYVCYDVRKVDKLLFEVYVFVHSVADPASLQCSLRYEKTFLVDNCLYDVIDTIVSSFVHDEFEKNVLQK